MSYSIPRDPVTGAPHATSVRRDADGAFIGADPGNVDRQAYEHWLAAGHTASVDPEPAVRKTVTGDRWALAIGDLGLAGHLMTALAAAKPGDRHRYGLIARDTPLSVDEPLLLRICARSGGAIDVAAVFDHANALAD